MRRIAAVGRAAFFVIVVAVVVARGCFSIGTAAGLSMPDVRRAADVVPEDWHFFVYGPEVSNITLYRQAGSSWQIFDPGRAEGWNFARAGRALEQLAHELSLRVPATAWRSCAGTPDSCAPVLPRFPLEGEAPLCGDFVFAVEPAVQRRPPVRPGVARLELRC